MSEETLSMWDIQSIWVRHVLYTADVSDFGESEIRCLTPKNPVPLNKMETWDKILLSKEPIQGDFGMNKERKLFHYRFNKWKQI